MLFICLVEAVHSASSNAKGKSKIALTIRNSEVKIKKTTAAVPEESAVMVDWKDIPRNAQLEKKDIERFFSEFSSANDLNDEEAVERGAFLVRHFPPKEYFQLKVRGKFTQIAKRLNLVNLFYHF